jgi:NADPH:quinone reductase-like Zn-dependent oxidoreductase
VRAAVYERFGPPDVLVIRDLAEPSPGRSEVLVDVRAASVNPKDLLIRKGKLRWLSGRGFPRPTGFDLAGIVAGVGEGVARLRVGDRVFGFRDGLRGGTVAQRIAVPEGELARAPGRLSFEEAAAVPLVGVTAIQALRDLGRLRAGERVCIHGASGGLGTLCIQVARALGGVVTSVSSDRNLDLCRELGAAETLDYRRDDPLARRWDLFMDCFGDRPYERVRHALAPGGRYVSVVIRARAILREAAVRFGVLRSPARLVSVRPRVADLELLARWLDDGIVRPAIDRVFALDAIADAHRHLEGRHARGKVVVAIGVSSG